MEDEVLEVKPNKLKFSITDTKSVIQIQNLTLHFIEVKIKSPNPVLFNIMQTAFSIPPCTTVDVNIQLILNPRMNLLSLANNRKITIFYYDADEMEESMDQQVDWSKVELSALGRIDIPIDYEIESLKYTIYKDDKISKLVETTLIFEPIRMNNMYITLTDDMKKCMLEQFEKLIGHYDNYKVMDDKLLFIANKFETTNEILVLQLHHSLIYVAAYRPTMIIQNIPKHQPEPMSPQKQIKQQKVSHIQPIEHQSVEQQIKSDVIIRTQEQQLDIAIPPKSNSKPLRSSSTQRSSSVQRSQSIQIPNSAVLYKEQITRQSFIENNWEKKAKQEQQSKVTPVVFKQENIQPQQESLKVEELVQLRTYQSIQLALLFRDGKYLVSVGEKQDIKVWSLQIKGVVGQLKDLENKKKILILQEWRYVDFTADENYEFQQKDPQDQKPSQIQFTKYETAYRFITGSEDQIFRIFNLSSMKMEHSFNCRLSIPTSLEFLPDRGLFCIGGQPNTTIFGQHRKYRSVRFYRMDNLQEKPKYKIFCKNEDDYLNSIVYSENPIQQEQHTHARLNNTLMIQMHRRNSQGKQIVQSSKLYFVFIDRMNQFTVLLTLECDQLNIRGVSHVKYLHKQGQFAIIESNDVVNTKNNAIQQNMQKVVVVNIKQLLTQTGMQNGIECCLIQEQSTNLSIEIITNPTVLVVPQGNQIQFQKFVTSEQVVHVLDVGDPRVPHKLLQLHTIQHYVVSVVDDTIVVISIQ